MLKILVLLVFSIVGLSAKIIPIQQKLEFIVPSKKSVIFEFPFKIDVKATPFYTKEVQDEKKDDAPIIIKPNINGEATITNDKIVKKTDKVQNFNLKAGENIIEIFSKKSGTTEIVIWGYDYPIMINLIVDESLNENAERYFRFQDYKIDEKKAIAYETNSHEKILEKLLVGMYKDIAPGGFAIEIKPIVYSEKGVEHKLQKRFVGYNYLGEVWEVKNIESEPFTLYEEMYANEKIFLVSLETDVLEKDEVTRIFIIREK